MAGLIPALNATGLYTLRAPFDTVLLPQTSYGCVAIRRLEDIVAAGGDPFDQYFAPKGITRALYETDAAAGCVIVSLQSSSGQWVYVPSTYIASMPEQGGVPYTSMLLGIKIGAVPDSLDLSFLKTKISEIITATLGVSAEIREVANSPKTLLNQTQHSAAESARAAAVTSNQTDYSKFLAAQALADARLLKIQQLEAWIRTNP
jgi:hypothetical protein